MLLGYSPLSPGQSTIGINIWPRRRASMHLPRQHLHVSSSLPAVRRVMTLYRVNVHLIAKEASTY